jgi:hypothetical protein
MATSQDRHDFDDETEEGGQKVDILPGGVSDQVKTPRLGHLQRVRRDLSEDELSSPATLRFLVAEIERLDKENSLLESFRDRYYQKDKESSILSERMMKDDTVRALSSVCLAVGSAGLGAAPSYIPLTNVGYVFLALSVALIVAGLFPAKITSFTAKAAR